MGAAKQDGIRIMDWGLLICVVPALCFAAAYGLQRRQRWPWYAGRVYLGATAVAAGYYEVGMGSRADTAMEYACAGLFTVGGGTLLRLFARKWVGLRGEFSGRQERERPANKGEAGIYHGKVDISSGWFDVKNCGLYI